MLKQFLKNSGIYGFSSLITKGISLILVPFYTRVFAPSDYGTIDLLSILIQVSTIIFPLEITQAIARFYPDTDVKEIAVKYASSGLYFTLLSLILGSLLILIFTSPINFFLFHDQLDNNTFMAACFCIISNGLFYFVQNQLRWRLEPKKQAFVSIVYSIITISITILFVLVLKTGVSGVFWAMFIGGLMAFLLGLFLSKSSYSFVFDFSLFREMLNFSLPLVPSSIGVFFLMYADRIMITSMMTLKDLGLFGLGYRVASIVVLLNQAIQSAIVPLIYAKYKDEGTPFEIARIFRMFIAGALTIFILITIFANEILRILTTPDYYFAANVIPFLIVSTFLSGLYVFAPGIGIAKKTRIIAIVNILGAVLNISLNYFLIPYFGIIAASVSTLISSAFIFSAYIHYSQKYYYIPHNPGLLFTSVIITLILAGFGFLLPVQGIIFSILIKIIIFLAFVAMLFITKIITVQEFVQFKNKIKLKLS